MKKFLFGQLFVLSLMWVTPSSAVLYTPAEKETAFSWSIDAESRLDIAVINQKNKRQTSMISSSQAANIVKSRFGGKILKVQRQSSGYRVKVLKKDGRILNVYVDGATGRIKG